MKYILMMTGTKSDFAEYARCLGGHSNPARNEERGEEREDHGCEKFFSVAHAFSKSE